MQNTNAGGAGGAGVSNFDSRSRHFRSTRISASTGLNLMAGIVALLGGYTGPVEAARPVKTDASSSMPTIQRGTASFYNVASTIREGTCTNAKAKICLQANGHPLNDHAYTAASWDYPFGTNVQVCNQHNNKCVNLVIADRGPSKKLYRQGRIIDLSQSAFLAISSLKSGVIPVIVKVKH